MKETIWIAVLVGMAIGAIAIDNYASEIEREASDDQKVIWEMQR